MRQFTLSQQLRILGVLALGLLGTEFINLLLSNWLNQFGIRPREPVDLSGVIGTVMTMLRPLARERGCSIHFRAAEGFVVPGNADQLQQVFTNLVENAIKYGGTENRVDITLESHARDTTLRMPAIALCTSRPLGALGRGSRAPHRP